MLFGYKTLSQQSFDINYISLGLSVAKLHVICYVHVYRLTWAVFFFLNWRTFVNIHKTKNSNDLYFVVHDGIILPSQPLVPFSACSGFWLPRYK